MLTALPVELVQLVAVRVPLATIASLARVCRFTAACVAEPAFWRSVAEELGVPLDVLARIDDTDALTEPVRRAALCEAIRVHAFAHEFDSEQRVFHRGIAFSANRHAVCANNGGWNTVMSARTMHLGSTSSSSSSSSLHAASPRVLCFRVACMAEDSTLITFRLGVTTAPRMRDYRVCAVELPHRQLCLIGEFDSQARNAWSAGDALPANRPPIGHLTIAADTSTPGHAVMIVSRSATQPRTAIVVMLVLQSAELDSESATVQLCFARRLELPRGEGGEDDDAFSVIATLSGAHTGCVCMLPPRQLVARARELVAEADEPGAPIYLEHMHGAAVDAPRFVTRGDESFLAFLSSVRDEDVDDTG
jgi:hypothetical protein